MTATLVACTENAFPSVTVTVAVKLPGPTGVQVTDATVETGQPRLDEEAVHA